MSRPVSSTRKLISSSSFHRLDMTLAVAEALNPNKPEMKCSFRKAPPPSHPHCRDARRLGYQGRPWAGKDPVLKGAPSSLKEHLHP